MANQLKNVKFWIFYSILAFLLVVYITSENEGRVNTKEKVSKKIWLVKGKQLQRDRQRQRETDRDRQRQRETEIDRQ
jgi:hypothetical protein